MSEPTDHEARDMDAAAERELARLYHGGPLEEPPPDLDERILAAAETGHRRRRYWPMAGLATAAVAILAVAVLLRTAVDDPSFHEPSFHVPEQAATAADAPAARPPPPARPAPFQRLSQVEEVIVTATREKSADQAGIRYTAAGCQEPYPLPQGATIRSIPDGIEIATDDAVFTVHCRAGQWQRQPAP